MPGSLRQLFAIFVIAGLIWAPLTAPAAAGAMRSALMPEMADDMPCCPPALPRDCQKCPLIGLCIAKTFQGMPAEAVMSHPTWSHSRMGSPSSDGARDGLGYLPPPRPPRSLGPSA